MQKRHRHSQGMMQNHILQTNRPADCAVNAMPCEHSMQALVSPASVIDVMSQRLRWITSR